MPLTDAAIKGAKPQDKQFKLFDSGGMFLIVTPSGGKWWRLKYRFGGKEKLLSLGVYPDTSLKEARRKRDEARELLAKGIDPGEEKKERKAQAAAEARVQACTFESVASEWFAKKTAHLTEDYRKGITSRLNMLYPHIGAVPIAHLEPADILAAVRPAELRGAIETAHRLVQLAGQVCRYARIAGYCRYDVASGLSEALPPVKTTHRAAITDPVEVGHLLRAIDEYKGKSDPSVHYALKLLPYVFVRSGELRAAEWKEIDLEGATWVIPQGRMKMRQPHHVPLARQVLALLTQLKEFSGNGALLFPSPFSASRCISDMGLLNALRRMGYTQEQMCVHGFRGLASTLLNEQGYRPDVIEAQLAHCERNSVRKAYNHAQYLDERRDMMQRWADYLDQLKAIS